MKRLIFTLLYDRGRFMLSRNFRLQSVGTMDWLLTNYDFASVSRGLDELMILDVTKGQRDPVKFAMAAETISSRCFIPATFGGGITSFEIAQSYIRSGADKLLLNSGFHHDPALCRRLADHFGRQCIVAGVDYRRTGDGKATTWVDGGATAVSNDLSAWTDHVQANGAGEVLLQSIDKDGTGMALDLPIVDELGQRPSVPVILMGGVGKAAHIIEGLQHPGVDAVATANLFNFIASAFLEARDSIAAAGIDVPHWDISEYGALRGRFAEVAT
jgi:cyclase